MKSKILTAGLIAAMMVPAMAQAQTRELARDRQDIRQEQRDLNHAKRYGDRHDAVSYTHLDVYKRQVYNSVTSSPIKKRAMSKSWIVMSRKMPPDTLT